MSGARWGLMLALGLSGPAWAREAAAPDLSQPTERAEAQLDVLEGLLRSNMVTDALAVAAQLRASGMHDPRLDLLQARAMHAQGMNAQALDMLTKLTRRTPRSAAAWSELGLVRADQDDTEGAVAALERARRLAPTDAGVLNNLGYLTMAAGRSARAVELFEAALVQDPSSVRTRNNLGFALARLERDTAALEAFRSAGAESDARYNLGVACELRGDTASALNQYQAALSAAPDHPAAAAALARLLHPESP